MSNKMKIDLDSLDRKLNEEQILEYKEQLEEAVTIFLSFIYKQNESGISYNNKLIIEDTDAENYINNYACVLSKKLSNDSAKKVLDSLRHAFCSFAFNGLHQLFTHQEREIWYPKIILDEELIPNDIHVLPSNITLYRGTNRTEFNTKHYGQSWSTCRQTAYNFAFKHYAAQPWFEETDRIILKTIFPKEYVYFSNQSCEFEVVIDTSKITDVSLLT